MRLWVSIKGFFQVFFLALAGSFSIALYLGQLPCTGSCAALQASPIGRPFGVSLALIGGANYAILAAVLSIRFAPRVVGIWLLGCAGIQFGLIAYGVWAMDALCPWCAFIAGCVGVAAAAHLYSPNDAPERVVGAGASESARSWRASPWRARSWQGGGWVPIGLAGGATALFVFLLPPNDYDHAALHRLGEAAMPPARRWLTDRVGPLEPTGRIVILDPLCTSCRKWLRDHLHEPIPTGFWFSAEAPLSVELAEAADRAGEAGRLRAFLESMARDTSFGLGPSDFGERGRGSIAQDAPVVAQLRPTGLPTVIPAPYTRPRY